MIVSLIRTAILYVAVIVGMRIMGKRQIGDMQPNELVITILISEVATIPIQDMDQPILNGITAIALLVSMEVILSVLTLKSGWVRRAVNGRPVMVIHHGKLDQVAMKKLRMTVDDLMESLRQNQVFDLTQVEFALVETNGNVSVMLTPQNQPLTPHVAGIETTDKGMPVPVVCDGKLQPHFMQAMSIKESKIKHLLSLRQLKPQQVYLMTIDSKGTPTVIKKENKK